MEEKSLGCIRKGGTRPIVEVLPETARPTKQGEIIMDTPGYDIASVTSMVAGGGGQSYCVYHRQGNTNGTCAGTSS